MNKTNDYNDLLTVYETAAALGVSRQVLYKRLRRGVAPAHVRIGDRTYFERASVAEHKQRGNL